MAVDGLILNQETKSLQAVVPAKINKISQPSDSEILLSIRANYKNQQLLICAHSQYNRINISENSYINPTTPSAFIMLLRKYLENGIITSIQQGGLDRYLIITINKSNEVSDRKIFYLYVELMGKYANVILCDSDNKILDALKRIPPYENTKRVIFAGAKYIPNEKIDKKNPLINDSVDLDDSLVNQFDGFSPLLAKEVQHRMVHGELFKSIMEEVSSSQSIYFYPDSKCYHVLPLKHLNQVAITYPINQGFDLIYQDVQERLRIEQFTDNISKTIRSELKKLHNKLPKLVDGLTQARDCDKWRIYGDLIFSNIQQIKGNRESITLFNYETSSEVEIPLDKKFDAKYNARKYYQKYQKGRNAQSHLVKQIKICEDLILYFTILQEQLEISDFHTAKEIQEELIEKGYIRKKIKKIKNKKINYQEYTINDKKVYLGKNNLQNDYVTFKLSRKNYTWFHTKDYHGAHVAIDSNKLNEEEIRFCANLAAYYSKGRLSSSVPVNYTLVKNLKKIPNSPAGLVSISDYKTIFIDPVKPD